MEKKVSSKKRLPRFKNETDEAEFWATHDSTDCWSDFEDVEEPLELDPDLVKAIDDRRDTKV